MIMVGGRAVVKERRLQNTPAHLLLCFPCFFPVSLGERSQGRGETHRYRPPMQADFCKRCKEQARGGAGQKEESRMKYGHVRGYRQTDHLHEQNKTLLFLIENNAASSNI